MAGPPYANWGDAPVGEQNRLTAMQDQWEQLVGYQIDISNWDLLTIANYWDATSLSGFAQGMAAIVATQRGQTDQAAMARMPWAQFGMGSDEYHSLATTYESEYKKLTGQDIPPDALNEAFKSQKDVTGGLLSGAEYGQRLLADVNLQKTYGWLKYGLDYNQFQQQKLSMAASFGKEIDDKQAVTQLQYWHQNASAQNQVRSQQPQQQNESAGAGGASVIR